jgi:prepilin-type N-terminal cleavage/methylation domain-containing protein
MRPMRETKRRLRRGFTIIEVLIGVLILSIGLIGIFGMQSVAIVTNRVNYDVRVASELAESAMERMRLESGAWVTAGGWPPGSWLDRVLSTPGLWVAPPMSAPAGIPTINDLGVPRGVTGSGTGRVATRNSRYCMRMRSQFLGGTSFARVEVQVLWPRNRDGERTLGTDCQNVFLLDDLNRRAQFYMVQVTGTVSQNASIATN